MNRRIIKKSSPIKVKMDNIIKESNNIQNKNSFIPINNKPKLENNQKQYVILPKINNNKKPSNQNINNH